MNYLRLNTSALIVATIISSLCFTAEKAAAQAKTLAKPVPTAKKPTGVKTATKAVLQNSTPKAQETARIIVTATSVRIRREPDFAAETVQTARIGEVFSLLEQNADWCKIRFGKTNDESAIGWIAKKLTSEFTDARRAEIYRSVADKYFKQSSPSFTDLAQATDFLTTAQKEFKDASSQADFAFRRLFALKTTLDRIPFEKQTENPFADFLEKNKGDIVYSEPSGKWLVRSELFWALRERYKNLPVAEEIAWAAAQNPIPGECEGYVNCYLYLLRATEGEYLNFYPNGKYSRRALKNLTDFLEPIAADAQEKAVYSSATDTSDRADFNKYLTELRAIVSKTPHLEKSKTLAQIKRIAEAYR